MSRHRLPATGGAGAVDSVDGRTGAVVLDDLYLATAELGAANGVASLGADGLVPSAQLPASGGASYPDGLRPAPGFFVTVPTPHTTNNYFAANVYVTPVAFVEDITIDQIGVYCTAGITDATGLIGIYDLDAATRRPTTAVTTLGEVGLNLSGFRAISVAHTFPAGIWGLAIKTQAPSGTPNLHALGSYGAHMAFSTPGVTPAGAYVMGGQPATGLTELPATFVYATVNYGTRFWLHCA